MADKLRWGVLGNAAIGRICVMPAMERSRNGVIRALGTHRPGEASKEVRDHHIHSLYDDYDAVIDDPAVDAVYVPLPNRLHRPWTVKALNAGKHVLCEKPIGCTAGEAREMAAAARENGRLLMEAQMYRFHPRTRRVKALAAAGRVGEPRLVRAAFCFAMDPSRLEDRENHRLHPKGGGALLDVGCYTVSVARWLLDAEPLSVQAQAVYHRDSGVDVHLVGNMRMGRDAMAAMEASFCSGLQQTYSLVGTEGAIDLPHDAFIPWEKDAALTLRENDRESGEVMMTPGADEYRLMVEHFADCALTGRTPDVAIDDSIRNMAALDALAEAARTGRTVRL